MKKTERTGKAFYMKWLLLALFAAALIIMPAASQKVSAAKMVYTVKFNNNSGTSKSKTYTALTRNVTLNTTIKLPSVPNAVGYQNLGWTTQKGSTKVVYKAGASVKVTRDMNLYAVRRKSRYYTVSSPDSAIQIGLCEPWMVYDSKWKDIHCKEGWNKD